jgi:hypothetical protein
MSDPTFSYPGYENLVLIRPCFIEGCNGASPFGPDWKPKDEIWEICISCSCGCENSIYEFGIDYKDWEQVF